MALFFLAGPDGQKGLDCPDVLFVGFRTDFVTSVRVSVASVGVLAKTLRGAQPPSPHHWLHPWLNFLFLLLHKLSRHTIVNLTHILKLLVAQKRRVQALVAYPIAACRGIFNKYAFCHTYARLFLPITLNARFIERLSMSLCCRLWYPRFSYIIQIRIQIFLYWDIPGAKLRKLFYTALRSRLTCAKIQGRPGIQDPGFWRILDLGLAFWRRIRWILFLGRTVCGILWILDLVLKKNCCWNLGFWILLREIKWFRWALDVPPPGSTSVFNMYSVFLKILQNDLSNIHFYFTKFQFWWSEIKILKTPDNHLMETQGSCTLAHTFANCLIIR